MGSIEGGAGPLTVLPASELVRVDLEGDGRIRVSELTGHEHDVLSGPDEQAGVAVAEAVERQSTIGPHAGTTNGVPEGVADLAIVERPTGRGDEHEVIGTLGWCNEPEFTKEADDGRGQDDLAPSVVGLGGPCSRQRVSCRCTRTTLSSKSTSAQVSPRPSPMRNPVYARTVYSAW